MFPLLVKSIGQGIPWLWIPVNSINNSHIHSSVLHMGSVGDENIWREGCCSCSLDKYTSLTSLQGGHCPVVLYGDAQLVLDGHSELQ